MLGGGRGNLDLGLPLQARLPLPPMNGSLKGTSLAIFDGNQRNMKQFMQECTLYQMINQEAPTM